jgi:tetratricopeptide (TPR) repeat protein
VGVRRSLRRVRRDRPGEGTPQQDATPAGHDIDELTRLAEAATDDRRWSEAAQRYEELAEALGDRVPPRVHARLCATQRRARQLDDAERSAQRAVADHPLTGRLWREAGEVSLARGEEAEALARFSRSLELEGDAAPAVTYARLSMLHRRAGEGDRADVVGGRGLEFWPEDPDLWRERATVAAAAHDWRRAADAWSRFGELVPDVPARWVHRHARCLERAGDLAEAAVAYDRALDALGTVDEPWANEAAVTWRFRRDHVAHRLDPQDGADPRFGIRLGPDADAVGDRDAPGWFTAEVTYKGVWFDGEVELPGGGGDGDRTVTFAVDGTPVRRVNLDTEVSPAALRFHLKHEVLATFPPVAAVTVTRTVDGVPLTTSGASRLRVEVPHGDASLAARVGAGVVVTKKGTYDDREEFDARRVPVLLDAYERLRRYFCDQVGQPLLLMYGSLLGFHRDGDFIPGDDDLDLGFLTGTDGPAEAKQVAVTVAEQLLAEGFDVTTRFGGNLLKLHAGGAEIDVYPLWFRDGRLWGYDAVEAEPGDVLPARTGQLRGVEVDVPRRPEVLLEGTYGPGWRWPEPGFRHLRRTEHLAALAEAALRPSEGRALAERNAEQRAADPSAGRFEVTRDPYSPRLWSASGADARGR